MKEKRWKLVDLQSIKTGGKKKGQLVVVEPVKLDTFITAPRIYYILTQEESVRGGHYHPEKNKEEIIICLQGEIEVTMHSVEACETMTLSSPDKGLFIPHGVWHQVKMSPGSILLSIEATLFDSKESIETFPYKCECGEFKGKLRNF